MLARSRPLVLRSGTELVTPLLVPSVTSKGFQLREDGLSEVGLYLEVARDHLTETLLVSAYDLHHRLLPQAEELLTPQHWSTIYGTPSLLVIDSGGYELSDRWEDSDLLRELRSTLPFTSDQYEDLLARLPRDRDLLVVTYDHLGTNARRPGYDHQIAHAAEFFGRRRDMMSDVLLKPPYPDRYVSADRLAQHARELTVFDVVGVTERELGETLLDRLVAIAELRQLLDDSGVNAPLHVFGVLEPLLVTLFYVAGAEIFDGLTWLRYGQYHGTSVNRASVALLDDCLDEPDAVVGARAQVSYLAALTVLKRSLRQWTGSGGDFALLPYFRDELERAYGTVMSRLQHKGE